MTAFRVAALVPAYEAATTVGDVVRGVAAIVSPVVVVDDGSADATGEVARAAGATVLRQNPNAGKGAALLTGLRSLAGTGFTHAVTVDADGQHPASEIPVLLAAAREQPCAIVVGVRQKEGHTIRRAARFGNWIADRLMTLVAGRPLPDTQSGLRVYPIAETLGLGAVGRRFDFETEILFRAEIGRAHV